MKADPKKNLQMVENWKKKTPSRRSMKKRRLSAEKLAERSGLFAG